MCFILSQIWVTMYTIVIRVAAREDLQIYGPPVDKKKKENM